MIYALMFSIIVTDVLILMADDLYTVAALSVMMAINIFYAYWFLIDDN